MIAATNRDLEAAIRTGGFRQDLFFRLNVVQIKLPSLRERKADIPLLVNSFLEKFSDPAHPIHTISEDAMRRIMAYDWPGNIRELENAIERAAALGSGPILHVGDLPSNLQYNSSEKLPDSDEMVSAPSAASSGAQFSARFAKPPEINWPPRACWGSARPRCIASSSNMESGRPPRLEMHVCWARRRTLIHLEKFYRFGPTRLRSLNSRAATHPALRFPRRCRTTSPLKNLAGSLNNGRAGCTLPAS